MFYSDIKRSYNTIEEKCKFSDKVAVFFLSIFLLEFSELHLELNSNPKPNKVKLLMQ